MGAEVKVPVADEQRLGALIPRIAALRFDRISDMRSTDKRYNNNCIVCVGK
jgi:hypothetical protein